MSSQEELIVRQAILSTLVVAAVATFGDWIWATFLSQHVMAAGLIHGALLCLAIGAVIGLPHGKVATAALAGIVIGFAAAGLFYLLAPMLRYSAMFPAWFALWVLFGVLAHKLAPGTPLRLAITRGIIAGVASGLAFYLVSGMWTRWNPATINYVDHAARWIAAFAPGFFALQGGRRAGVPVRSDIM
jgi:hypothetical protein